MSRSQQLCKQASALSQTVSRSPSPVIFRGAVPFAQMLRGKRPKPPADRRPGPAHSPASTPSAGGMLSINVHLYTELNAGPTRIHVAADETAEELCVRLCRQNAIKPTYVQLFALRLHHSGHFVPCNRRLTADETYDFRMRFIVGDLGLLNSKNAAAYDYLCTQFSRDVLSERIAGLEYPQQKDKVLGVCTTIMLLHLTMRQSKVSDAIDEYRQFVPAKYVEKHRYFLRTIMKKALLELEATNLESCKLKEILIESVRKLAPEYLIEKYNGVLIAEQPNDKQPASDDAKAPTVGTRKYAVELKLVPHHPTDSGLHIVHTSVHQQQQQHIQLSDLYALLVEHTQVQISVRNNPRMLTVHFADVETLESFVSNVCGYYRLAVDWTMNLCATYESALLNRLLIDKVHGPVTGLFGYKKLNELRKRDTVAWLVRQSEDEFGCHYADCVNEHGTPSSHLIDAELLTQPDKLLEEVKRKVPSKMAFLRYSPSAYDRAPNLLLCRPVHSNAMQAVSESQAQEMRTKKTKLLDLYKDITPTMNTARLTDNRSIRTMKAVWRLPRNNSLDVQLKTLRDADEKKLQQFTRLARDWSALFAPELVKLYGYTLSDPHTLVMESFPHGQLDNYLIRTKNVSMVCLLDAMLGLLRAVHYLHDHQIVHGNIRCAKLMVFKHVDPYELTVRLGDPGLAAFTEDDRPWHPADFDKDEKARKKDDVYAVSTTMWQISARGFRPTLMYLRNNRNKLPRVVDCPADVYMIMLEGWKNDEKFIPQTLYQRIVSEKDLLLKESKMNDDSLSYENRKNVQIFEHVDMIEYEDDEPENPSEQTENGQRNANGASTNQMPIVSTLTNKAFDLPDERKLVINICLGSGNYGEVYQATLQLPNCKYVTDVAVKTLKRKNTEDMKHHLKDIERERQIMQTLDHPNIVRVLGFLEKPASIIMELIECGSALQYVCINKDKILEETMLRFACDIAKGMAYLVSMHIVHRDLAARNVLIDKHHVAKISDFGLAQKAEEGKDYYQTQNTTRMLPVDWYAPEILHSCGTVSYQYKHYSDVWSYGVTLYEIFSCGQEPKLILNSYAVDPLYELLKSGTRLKQPDKCPDDLYRDVLQTCWSFEPLQRPTFDQLVVILERFISGKYGDM